jgi:hypothetical protein
VITDYERSVTHRIVGKSRTARGSRGGDSNSTAPGSSIRGQGAIGAATCGFSELLMTAPVRCCPWFTGQLRTQYGPRKALGDMWSRTPLASLPDRPAGPVRPRFTDATRAAVAYAPSPPLLRSGVCLAPSFWLDSLLVLSVVPNSASAR